MEGTNKGHENAEGMALVGVRLTDQLGAYFCMSGYYLSATVVVQTFAQTCSDGMNKPVRRQASATFYNVLKLFGTVNGVE